MGTAGGHFPDAASGSGSCGWRRAATTATWTPSSPRSTSRRTDYSQVHQDQH